MIVALDVAIGIAFLYLLLALLVTTVQELVATWWRFRAHDLYAAIASMLSRDGAVPREPAGTLKAFIEHPLIRNLIEPNTQARKILLPSYLEPRLFAQVIIDILLGGKAPSQVTGADRLLESLKGSVSSIENNDRLKESLLAVLRTAEGYEGTADAKAGAISKAIADWFDERMARASGWYKRRAQTWALIMAGVLAVIANADSIHVGEALWLNATLRESIVASAQAFVTTQAPASSPPALASSESAAPAASGSAPPCCASAAPGAPKPPTAPPSPAAEAGALIDKAKGQISALGNANFPIGWSGVTWSFDYLGECWFWKAALSKLLGWLLTALAVSLGSGFWFDTLSKFLQLRGTGPKVAAKANQPVGSDS